MFSSLTSNDVRSALSDMNMAPIRKLLVPIVLGFVANYVLEDYKKTQLETVARELAKISAEKLVLENKLKAKTGYDEKKKSLDGDESLVRTKLDTIKKLVDGRAGSVQILLALSAAMPQDVWLTEFTTRDMTVELKGTAIDIGQISDFIKNLNQSTSFQGIELKTSSTVKDALTGNDVAAFELAGQRRKE